MENVSLPEATLEQIVDELKSRFRTVVLCVDQEANGVASSGVSEILHECRGPQLATLGAAYYLLKAIEKNLMADDEPEE